MVADLTLAIDASTFCITHRQCLLLGQIERVQWVVPQLGRFDAHVAQHVGKLVFEVKVNGLSPLDNERA
jgi:hypothetical protein